MSNIQRGLTAAIGSVLLSLSVLSGAPAQGCEQQPDHKAIHNSSRAMTKPSTEFRSVPSWPEGEPDYHGSNGG